MAEYRLRLEGQGDLTLDIPDNPTPRQVADIVADALDAVLVEDEGVTVVVEQSSTWQHVDQVPRGQAPGRR